MSVMAATVVRELGLMHLVSGSETYKTASGVVTQALGQIDEVPVKVGGVQCTMTFMVVDIDSYDVLLGLDLLIKIGAIVDVERGLIQVRHGLGTKVEVLPLTMVNMLQKTNSETMVQEVAVAMANTHRNGKLDAIVRQPSLCEHNATRQTDACVSDSDSDTNEDQVQQVDTADSHDNFKEQLALSNNQKVSSRWEEICQRIRIDQNLDEKKGQQLWGV
ncbi:unnamed protein product [Sphagnum jensenii]|uniref:Uncharacterized protein n=1 Tax=Sphagnum jensenii TaxID=128206 RepID=A0ABP0W260_9BRYO